MTTAIERLKQADELDNLANKMGQRKDTENAERLHRVARRKRASAIKSMNPRRKSAGNLRISK